MFTYIRKVAKTSYQLRNPLTFIVTIAIKQSERSQSERLERLTVRLLPTVPTMKSATEVEML